MNVYVPSVVFSTCHWAGSRKVYRAESLPLEDLWILAWVQISLLGVCHAALAAKGIAG